MDFEAHYKYLEINLLSQVIRCVGGHIGNAKGEGISCHHLAGMCKISKADFGLHIRSPRCVPAAPVLGG